MPHFNPNLKSYVALLKPKQIAKFLRRIDYGSPTDCWLWKGSTSPKGYGTTWVKFGGQSITVNAHRLMYEIEHGSIPSEHVIDHLCRNHLCVNPAHLEAVTNAENVRRGIHNTGGNTGAFNRAKTHCPHGHLYPPRSPNDQQRRCAPCRALGLRRLRATKRLAARVNERLLLDIGTAN